jgi:hypothetical protein
MTVGVDLDAALADLQAQINLLSGGITNSFGFTGFKNLKIACRAAQSTYEISFDGCILKDVSGNLLQLGADSMVLDVTVSGMNGLDTGSLAAGWYRIFVISDGTTTESILSALATPTLPSGYAYYEFAGWAQVFSVSPVDLSQSLQYGNQCVIQARGALSSTGVAANAVNTLQALDLSDFVPPDAKFISGFMGGKPGSRKMMAMSPWNGGAYDVGRINAHGPAWSPAAGFDNFGNTDNFSDFAIENQTLYWKAGDTQAANILYVTGYRF